MLLIRWELMALNAHTPREFDIEFPETALAWAK